MAITVGGVLFTNVDARGHCSNFALLRIGLKFFYRRQVGFLRPRCAGERQAAQLPDTAEK
jgi:hypothetical protein